MTKVWQIEIKLPKGKTVTHVYSDNGHDIVDRFPKYECKIIGEIDDPWNDRPGDTEHKS
jgi:hypothetical protein